MWPAIIFAWIAVCGVVGYYLGGTKGQPIGGFLTGVLLGPLGWMLIIIFGNSGARKCQDCRAVVDADARKCRHCGSVLAD
jgi:hypothetical protein